MGSLWWEGLRVRHEGREIDEEQMKLVYEQNMSLKAEKHALKNRIIDLEERVLDMEIKDTLISKLKQEIEILKMIVNDSKHEQSHIRNTQDMEDHLNDRVPGKGRSFRYELDRSVDIVENGGLGIMEDGKVFSHPAVQYMNPDPKGNTEEDLSVSELIKRKDYLSFIRAIAPIGSGRDLFKNVCLCRTGLFYEASYPNLLLGRVKFDYESGHVEIQLYMVSQRDVSIESINVINYGIFVNN